MNYKKLLSLLTLVPMTAILAGCPKPEDPDAIKDENQRHFHDQEERVTLRDVIHYGEGLGFPCASTGNARVLVVPIEFTDFPADDIGHYYNADLDGGVAKKHTDDAATHGRGADNAIEDIRKFYFGEPEETTWHSLSSYYKEASYGKLQIKGQVVPYWTKAFVNSLDYTPCSTAEFIDGGGNARILLSQIVNDIAKYDYNQYTDDDGNHFTSESKFRQYFDSDHDGYIDLVEGVYSAPFRVQRSTETHTQAEWDDIFWAYCGSSGGDPSTVKPKISKWAFQSYYTAVEGGRQVGTDWRYWTCQEIVDGLAKTDAHTVIHESGHGLGLPDYYNTDKQDGKTSGAVDMMAFNIGDHNSHSKSLLGWVDPVVVTGPTRVTINSFTTTGDCIYLPYRGYYDDGNDVDKKNKNTFNTEYIAIELMTPTGVNKADSDYAYMNSYPKVPDIAGIKAYHVDSRLAIKDGSSYPYKFVNYTSSIVNVESPKFVTHAHTNSPSTTVKNADGTYNFQLQYLYKNKDKNPGQITNASLYQQGDVLFDGNLYGDFKMNSGAALGYKVTIESLTWDQANPENASATLLFEAKH